MAINCEREESSLSPIEQEIKCRMYMRANKIKAFPLPHDSTPLAIDVEDGFFQDIEWEEKTSYENTNSKAFESDPE